MAKYANLYCTPKIGDTINVEGNILDSENRIKKLKYYFAIDGFYMKKLWTSEASFRMVIAAYNLMSLFRQRIRGMVDKEFFFFRNIQYFA